MSEKDERAERLAAQLRANLRRRKEQGRAMANPELKPVAPAKPTDL